MGVEETRVCGGAVRGSGEMGIGLEEEINEIGKELTEKLYEGVSDKQVHWK
jgi:hypothetical protein